MLHHVQKRDQGGQVLSQSPTHILNLGASVNAGDFPTEE